MMDFLFINSQELTALMELPWIQRVTYLMGIRPYMDNKTCIVGIKRKISYQSLREVLYVAPIAGVKTEYPNHEQVRRVVKSLERAGLIELQSSEKNLILKCVLTEVDRSVQNKADTRPTCEADTRPTDYNNLKSTTYQDIHKQADRGKTTQADTPHNSVNNYVFLCQQFEKFWERYPQPQNKAHAWNEFEKLNPDEALFSKILAALDAQINHYQQQQATGTWVPYWKYPGNWLAQRCWEEEIKTNQPRRNAHATHEGHSRKQPVDFFWESCKGGADYIPGDESSDEDGARVSNVVEFHQFRKTSKAH
jgi:hypothetical protein